MFMTGRRDYRANRWEPFVRRIHFEGYDFTGATFLAQVRAVKDSDGAALIDLATVGGVGTQGIAIVGVTTADGVPTTEINLRVNEATMEAIAKAVPLGDDYPLWWDLQITPSGGDKFRALEGKFIVAAGVAH
jgi:hypothetical protein